MFTEPPRSQGDLNFQLFGFPIRIHPYFWIFSAIMGAQGDLTSLLIWVVAVLVSILVHELGHAFAMRWFGARPWITLYGFGGLTSSHPGWGVRGRGSAPLGQIVISAAGPAAGFLLAGLIFAAFRLAGRPALWGTWYGLPMFGVLLDSWPMQQFVNDLVFVSFVWGFVNLLPVYPLDGGQIAREALSLLHPRKGIIASMFLSMAVAGAIAAYCVYQLGNAARTMRGGGDLFQLIQSSHFFLGLLFGALAYYNYVLYQSYIGRRPWM